jgi:ATP-binding cassette, subfamily C (CFTR/MRP), member 1
MASNYGSIASAAAATAAAITTETATTGSNAKNLPVDETEPLLEQDQTSPRQPANASIWSKLVFGWFGPVLEIGNDKKKLDPQDLQCIPLPKDCTTEHIMDKFNHYWEREKEKAKDGKTALSASLMASPSILRALYYSFGTDFIRAGFLKLVHDASLFVGPQVLNGLIYFLRDADAPMTRGLGLTAAVTVSQLLMSFCLRHYFFNCYLTGLRIRSAVVVAVYNKALVLHSAERQTRTLGEITNLISIDAQRMQDLTTYLHAVWYSFVQIGLALFFLFRQLGASCLGGVVGT